MDAEDGCKLYIGGLPFKMDEDSLRDLFRNSGYDGITEAVVIYDKDSGRSRGFGFLTFSSPSDASKCRSEMDGYEVDGRSLKVDNAGAKRSGGGRGGGRGGGGGYRSRDNYSGGGGDRRGYGGSGETGGYRDHPYGGGRGGGGRSYGDRSSGGGGGRYNDRSSGGGGGGYGGGQESYGSY